LIASQEERVHLAELNLLAGKRAKASSAYASALNYLVSGATVLPEDSWERRHENAFELELHRAECEFVTKSGGMGMGLSSVARLSKITAGGSGRCRMTAPAQLFTLRSRSTTNRSFRVGKLTFEVADEA